MTTKHAACTHPSTKAARAACRKGTAQPATPADRRKADTEARTERKSRAQRIADNGAAEAARCAAEPSLADRAKVGPKAAEGKIFIDSLGVKIEQGDRVIINAWGGSVRLTDVQAQGTVTGFRVSRITVDWDADRDAPAVAVRPDYVAVVRRDGKPGLQGNVDR